MSSENESKPEAEANAPSENEKEHCGHRGRCGGKRRFLWFIPLMILAIAAKAALAMLLWDALIPDLFHGPELSYVQSLGLMILAKLFVGFHHGGGFGRGRCHHGHGHFGHGHHRHRLHRHFGAHLTDEERQKLRENFRGRGHR